MFGISVFLGDEIKKEQVDYVHQVANHGLTGIFTSLHIPEEDASNYRERLCQLGTIAKEQKMTLMVDISGAALEKAGFSFEDLDELKEIGVTGLRMDYAISHQQIAKASQEITIGLNASTITLADIAELKAHQANFDNFEAWHNYYPRQETGLAKDDFFQKNQFLKDNGFRVVAFAPGDKRFRGPLFSGLPTLEDHRHTHPLAAALDLQSNLAVDDVYIGDPEIAFETMGQFGHWLMHHEILLRATRQGQAHHELVFRNHQNRLDAARDVIRSQDARFREVPKITPAEIAVREVGAVTIDNEAYGRYMGEVQVVKKELPKDPRVNTVAQVIARDVPLLSQIYPGSKFIIKEYNHD